MALAAKRRAYLSHCKKNGSFSLEAIHYEGGMPMHWMPMLAEAYILNRVREAKEERERLQQAKQDESTQKQSTNDKVSIDA